MLDVVWVRANEVARWKNEDGTEGSGTPAFPPFAAWLAAGNKPLPPLPATPAVPASVPLWKAKAVLSAHGLINATDAIIAASKNPADRYAWEYAPEISRASPLVNGAAAQLGLTAAQVDAMFIEADALAV